MHCFRADHHSGFDPSPNVLDPCFKVVSESSKSLGSVYTSACEMKAFTISMPFDNDPFYCQKTRELTRFVSPITISLSHKDEAPTMTLCLKTKRSYGLRIR